MHGGRRQCADLREPSIWPNHQAASVHAPAVSLHVAGTGHPVLPTATMGKKESILQDVYLSPVSNYLRLSASAHGLGSEGSPAWPWEGSRPQERQVGRASPAAVWTWTHFLSEPQVPKPQLSYLLMAYFWPSYLNLFVPQLPHL